jgi:Tfp pilus assembly ATPase PilU
MHFEEMLVLLVHKGVSDIHLHAGMPVLARIGDELRTVSSATGSAGRGSGPSPGICVGPGVKRQPPRG